MLIPQTRVEGAIYMDVEALWVQESVLDTEWEIARDHSRMDILSFSVNKILTIN